MPQDRLNGLKTDLQCSEVCSEGPKTGSNGSETDVKSHGNRFSGVKIGSECPRTGSKGLKTGSNESETGFLEPNTVFLGHKPVP